MTPIQQQRLIGAGLLVLLVAVLAYVVLSKVGQHQSEKALELPEPIEFSSVIEPIEEADDDSEAMVDADLQQITPAMDTEVVAGSDETASTTSAEAAAESEEADNGTQTEASDNTAEASPAQPVERPTAQADTPAPAPQAGSDNTDNPTVVAEPNAGNTVSGDRWLIQLGSFSVHENAQSLKAESEKLGYNPYIENIQTEKGALYRVRLPAIANRAEADDIAARIAKQLDIKTQVITQ